MKPVTGLDPKSESVDQIRNLNQQIESEIRIK